MAITIKLDKTNRMVFWREAVGDVDWNVEFTKGGAIVAEFPADAGIQEHKWYETLREAWVSKRITDKQLEALVTLIETMPLGWKQSICDQLAAL